MISNQNCQKRCFFQTVNKKLEDIYSLLVVLTTIFLQQQPSLSVKLSLDIQVNFEVKLPVMNFQPILTYLYKMN